MMLHQLFDMMIHYLINNQKQKNGLNNKQRKRFSNKSPMLIRGTYKPKDIFSFNKVFNSNKYSNEQKYNQNLINNYLFINNNNHFSKTFSSFHRKKDRSYTPILRTNNNKPYMNLGNNIVGNKIKREPKSPILGKSFNFRRNENFGIVLSNLNKDKNHKNINNVNSKGIKGDTHKEFFLNKGNNKLKLNRGINVVNVNLRPISHNNIFNNNSNKNKINLYDEEINMALLKLNNNNNEEKKRNIINNKENNNNNKNTRKIARPKSPKNNPNKNNLRNNINKNHIIIDDNNIENKKEKTEKIISEEIKNKDIENNTKEIVNNITNKIEEQKKEEIKPKKNIRSHSQVPLNPLKQNDEEESSLKRSKEKPKEENITPKKVIIINPTLESIDDNADNTILNDIMNDTINSEYEEEENTEFIWDEKNYKPIILTPNLLNKIPKINLEQIEYNKMKFKQEDAEKSLSRELKNFDEIDTKKELIKSLIKKEKAKNKKLSNKYLNLIKKINMMKKIINSMQMYNYKLSMSAFRIKKRNGMENDIYRKCRR